MDNKLPSEEYQQRVNIFGLEQAKLKTKLIYLSVSRFLAFVLAIVSFVFIIKEYSIFRLGLIFFFLAVFIFLVIYYIKQLEQLSFIKNLTKINKEELEVLKNNLKAFYNGEDFIDRDHPYSYDLDLFGEGSLYQYLNRTTTLVGRELLTKRLTNIKSTKEEIENKQNTIQELVKKLEWRQNFMATGYLCPVTKEDNKKIDYWIDKPVYFIKSLFYRIIVVLLPLVTISFLGLLIVGISHYSWVILFAILQLVVASLLLRKTNREQSLVSEELRILKNYSKLIKLIEGEHFSSDFLIKLQKDLKTDAVNAQAAFKKLIKIIDAFDTRLNIFLGVILNATLMWDLYSQMRLEKWKIKYGQNVKQWVKVIAEIDLYCSFSNYSFNNREFIYPKITDKTVIESEELGHPLIPQTKRVNNDFIINKKGEIDIITGANMAGKSTFLRTVGVNFILAMNGMPVCAKSFNFQIMELFSGMRTADSLKENESYFYAELKRLKYIIEKLKEGKPTFILLDEILKGTNSVDKAKGSWKFVEHLLTLQATGIVATHDLTLCELEKEYPDNIKNKCFEVEIDNEKVLFDYKLRQGVTQNMNASLLMKQMGIFTD